MMESAACHDGSSAQPGVYGDFLRDVDDLNATLGAMIAEAQLSSSMITVEGILSICIYALAMPVVLKHAKAKLSPMRTLFRSTAYMPAHK